MEIEKEIEEFENSSSEIETVENNKEIENNIDDLEINEKENKEENSEVENNIVELESEKANKEVLDKLNELDLKLVKMNELFMNKIQNIDFERNVTDKLHKELQEYKNDLYFKLIKPFVIDLINIRESIRRNLINFTELTEENKIELLRSYSEEIEISLENNDIEIYETNLEEDNSLNTQKQKIVKQTEVSEKELHGKVIKAISNGYKYQGKVIFPEKVEVSVYKEKEE